MARGLKFRIWKVDGLYYLCSENKGAGQLRVFVFAYAKSRFSHNEAHFGFAPSEKSDQSGLPPRPSLKIVCCHPTKVFRVGR